MRSGERCMTEPNSFWGRTGTVLHAKVGISDDWGAMTDELHWDLTKHVRGALAEALVAEAVYQRHPDAVLHSPRHPGFAVESEAGGLRVDAKAASLAWADTDGMGRVESVEWDAGGKEVLVHEDATHLGLTVLTADKTALKLFTGRDDVLEGAVSVNGRVFIVPRGVVEEHARGLWSAKAGRPGRGRFRYIPLAELEGHEVVFSRPTPEVVA